MQESRNKAKFVDEVERISIEQMVESSKANNRIGDKILMVINPLYVHIQNGRDNVMLLQQRKLERIMINTNGKSRNYYILMENFGV